MQTKSMILHLDGQFVSNWFSSSDNKLQTHKIKLKDNIQKLKNF